MSMGMGTGYWSQTDRQTDRQADRQADRQTDRQADRQISAKSLCAQPICHQALTGSAVIAMSEPPNSSSDFRVHFCDVTET